MRRKSPDVARALEEANSAFRRSARPGPLPFDASSALLVVAAVAIVALLYR